MTHKPTSEEKRIIRDCAARGAGFKRVEICPSTRLSLTNPCADPHMNIAFVSDDPDFSDTDLASNAFAWRDFARGVELKDGRGVFDFWIYNTGRNAELQTNVTAYYEDSRLVRVDEVSRGTMWRAPEPVPTGEMVPSPAPSAG